MKTRVCPRCARNLPRNRRMFTYRTRPDGAVWFGNCRRCDNEQRRARYRRARRDPARVAKMRAENREAMRRYRERHPERVAASQEAWNAKMRADRKRHAAFRVARRIEERARNGHHRNLSNAVEPYKPPTPPNSVGNGNTTAPMLDVTALRNWLAYEFGAWETGDVARRCGVNEATVRRILSGEQQRVSLHIADRMFVSADCPHLLAVLYPVDEAVAA